MRFNFFSYTEIFSSSLSDSIKRLIEKISRFWNKCVYSLVAEYIPYREIRRFPFKTSLEFGGMWCIVLTLCSTLTQNGSSTCQGPINRSNRFFFKLIRILLDIVQKAQEKQLYTKMKIWTYNKRDSLTCPVAWGCWVHRLLHCRGVTPSYECPEMTLNNLMVRFQWCWSFGECGVTLDFHCSQVLPGLKW